MNVSRETTQDTLCIWEGNRLLESIESSVRFVIVSPADSLEIGISSLGSRCTYGVQVYIHLPFFTRSYSTVSTYYKMPDLLLLSSRKELCLCSLNSICTRVVTCVAAQICFMARRSLTRRWSHVICWLKLLLSSSLAASSQWTAGD